MGFKFFKKRNVWLPTWPVILGLTLIIITSASVILFSSHDFLAVTNKVPNAKILVVESWMADNSMEQVAEIFNDSLYAQVQNRKRPSRIALIEFPHAGGYGTRIHE